MPLLHNDVFDAALTEVATCTEAEVQNASGTALVDAIVLDAANFGANGDYASGGREKTCLVEGASSDMHNISVGTAGSATKVALKAGVDVLVEASITGAPVSLGASDQVNLGTFKVILQDPT